MAAVTRPAHRPARAPVPPLPPFEALDDTHHRLLLALGAMEGWVDALARDGLTPSVRAEARRLGDFFAGEAAAHHLAEEEKVFPLLALRGDPVMDQHLARLRQDHGWIEEDWRWLAPQVEAVAEGYTWYDIDSLRDALQVFAALCADHVALEESLIYPAAREAVQQSRREARERRAAG